MADQIAVVGGVDTHTDFHQAAVIDTIGRHLATAPFPTTPDGYRRLLEWMRLHGDVLAVGVEGTGAYAHRPVLRPSPQPSRLRPLPLRHRPRP
ncbi:transposase [Streptomyces sp. NPDC002205]|uniref:IS110 family transposase n=1 Tax=Streptomyces sp. NPDC002205 TaxID=3154411 RepID=UPI003318BCE4